MTLKELLSRQGTKVAVPRLFLGCIHGSLIAAAGVVLVALSPSRTDHFRMVVAATFGCLVLVALVFPIFGRQRVRCPRCGMFVAPPMEDDPPVERCPSCALPVEEAVESQTSRDETDRIFSDEMRVRTQCIATGRASCLVWAVLWVLPATHGLVVQLCAFLIDAIGNHPSQ